MDKSVTNQVSYTDYKPKIYLFCCATSYDQTEVVRTLSPEDSEMKVISIPCSGKLDILYLTKAFEKGADGVAVMMCRDGDCRYLEGNLRAKKRIAAIANLLEETSLGRDRVAVIQLSENGTAQAIRDLDNFIRKIKSLTTKTPTTTINSEPISIKSRR